MQNLIYLFVFLLPWQTRWIFYDPKINGEVWEYGRMSLYGFDVVFIILIFVYLASLFMKLFYVRQKNGLSLVIKLPFVIPAKAGIQKRILNFFCLDPDLHQDDKKEGQDGKEEDTEDRNRKVKIYFFIFLYSFIFIILNIIFSQNKIFSLYWWLRVGEILGLLWILSRVNFSKIKLAWAFILSMVLSGSLGIYQFLTQNMFASKWLGIAIHKASDLGASVVEISNGERFLRAYGSLPHPNVLAGFIIVTIILLVWIMENSKLKSFLDSRFNLPFRPLKARGNDKKKDVDDKKELLYYLIALLLTIALFFTFSRAAWLVFLLVMSYWLLVDFKKNWKKVLGILGILGTLGVLYWPLVQTRLGLSQAPLRLEMQSVSERVGNYEEAWQIIKNNPVVGVGLGNYTLALQKNNPGLPGFKYQPVHNVLILAWAELGVLGFLGIFYFVFKKVKLGFKTQFNFVFFVFSFFCVFILLCADHFWWTLPSGMILILGGLGILGKRSEE